MQLTQNENVFGLQRIEEGNNVLFTGKIKYKEEQFAKVIVCKRPDNPRLKYKNTDLITVEKEILDCFQQI